MNSHVEEEKNSLMTKGIRIEVKQEKIVETPTVY